MTRTSLAWVVLLLTACSGKETPEPFTPDTTEVDTEVEEDTAVPTPTPTPPPGDTGTTFVAEVVGRATVNVAEATISGSQGVAFSWVDGDGNKGARPRCVQYSRFTDWANDEERDQQDPLRDKHPLCPGCTFSFTLSLRGQLEKPWLPWEAAPDGYDPDGPAPKLSCDVLRTWEVMPGFVLLGEPDEDLESYIGYGFKPSEDDPTVGAWMVWAQNEAIWAPYNYTATLQDGVFEWGRMLGTYYY